MPAKLRALHPALIAACVALAVAHAASLAWLCDDAFISFRYARNLVEGSGFVFNVGERVEGYTNPLWTLLIAAGMRLGASPERWSIAWGIASYAASIALLGLVHVQASARLASTAAATAFPLAALAGAAHPDWATFATSGLETPAFTFLVLAALVVLAEPGDRPLRRAAVAGSLLALAALTRHDGILFAVVAFAFLTVRRGTRAALALSLAFALVWGPFTAWRVWYYGAILPNTYYAKSADLAYWSQGLFYVRLYFQRYWLLALAPVAVVLFARRARSVADLAVLSSTFTLAYLAYVAKVGGDFMFGRMIVPVTPMLLILLDLAALHLASIAPRLAIPVGVASALTLLVLPAPTDGEARGVIDERAHFPPDRVAHVLHRAESLAAFFEGLPVVVAIYGDEARLAYYARIPVAIEAHTGLTDRFVAHQPLASRGRVGHEKLAPLDYLVEQRRADMTFSKVPTLYQALDDYIPIVHAQLGDVRARLLHWNPSLVDALRRRGAIVDDFPTELDSLIAVLPSLSKAQALRVGERARRFYFEHVQDPEREAAFARRFAE